MQLDYIQLDYIQKPNMSKTKTQTSKKFVKRTVKDTVFTSLFKDKKYCLKLYKELHPEDADVTLKDLIVLNLKAVLVNDLYNDLAILVRDKIIF